LFNVYVSYATDSYPASVARNLVIQLFCLVI
jgi:hypothetical protein